MSQHTPLPWSFTSESYNPEHGSFYIRDSEGAQLIWLGGSSRFANGENQANAEFITRACNSYHDMLEALEIAMEYLPDIDLEWAKKARAAITKAKGETQ